MMFNAYKCKVMHFGKRDDSSTDMTSQSPLTVTEEKKSWIVISFDTKSSQQCIKASSKDSSILSMINRAIVYKSSENLARLYKTLIRPHLAYCTLVTSLYQRLSANRTIQ